MGSLVFQASWNYLGLSGLLGRNFRPCGCLRGHRDGPQRDTQVLAQALDATSTESLASADLRGPSLDLLWQVN